ncbi:non-ribosomal peptide synthetase [Paraburkholderia humisilvae]|nr:non-ribosomal peptide synthetase [Paraburkholderia humisilvae]
MEATARSGSPRSVEFPVAPHGAAGTTQPAIDNAAAQHALAIARKYAALPAERRQRFRDKARDQGIDPARLPIVPLLQEGAHTYPLAPAQERLWFLWKLAPHNPAYHLARAMRVTGQLHVRALRSALDALVARHGALRACFVETRGVPVQRIAEEARYAWRERSLDDAARLRDTLRSTAREPFDLERGPLLRVELISLGAQLHVLQLVTHHIVSDGWSQALLLRELATLYRAALAGEGARPADALLPLELHFGDVAAWQAEWFDAVADDDLAYWRARLGVARPALELPLDRPRGAVRGIEGGRCQRDIGAALAARLREFARAQRTTLFTVLLGVHAALLYRYGGQTTVRIGVPSAGRQRRETEALIGYFANTLVLEADVDGALRFDALLAGLHQRVLEAHAHQAVPFGRVLDTLEVERDLGRSPLFQVMFNLEHATRAADVTMPGLIVEAEEGGTQTARFDLVLNVVDDGRGLRLMFNHAKDVFNTATVERIAAQYESLLRQLAEDGRKRVGELVLAGREGQVAREYGFASLGAGLVEQAWRTPEATALRCEDESLSYAQLDAWATVLAARLVSHGVCAERRVGLCVRRGPAMIAALLGVIRSGGAFVPLDPSYPAARLTQMIEDAGIVQVLADAQSADGLSDVLAGCEVIDVNGAQQPHDARCAPGDTRFSPAPLHPDQLAYVLYTSGSTGKPKGVAVSHGALWTHLQDFLTTYGISAADTVLHSSTINFDVALHETLPALLTGATVEMRGEAPWDLQSLSERLVSRRVTFARIPTALWQQWQRHAPPRSALALRQVTVGGEALPGDALAHWRAGALSDIALDNLYGPTETTVAALYRRTGAQDVHEVTVPIGVPYPGRSARVLDAFGDEAPAGGVGELCIGGPTVARGYLGRAGLTAERFVPDPQGGPGARQYRSGDLCRMREDGTVEFLGRLDQQVKLRGQRIELGEIEAVLRQGSGVREAAVIVKGEGAKQRLAAYVAGSANELDVPSLQRRLEQKLPAYMVPSTLTWLERLPLMPNGKLDRGGLPQPQQRERERVEPSNETEAQLLSIWSAVLGRSDLGVTDNFFEAGGDSIQSLQIIARAREVGLKLTPAQVFEHPTVAGQAQRAQQLEAGSDEAHDDGAALPLTPIQQQFFARYPEGESHWNQAVLLKVRGPLQVKALEHAVQAIAARHDALRLRFIKEADGWKQGLAAAEAGEAEQLVRHECLTSLEELEAACERIQSSLDIGRGPLWRVGYFETAQGDTRLLVAIHHLSVDGVSWRVLLDELQKAYEQAARNEPVTLPAASTPWRTWVRALHRYAKSSARIAELAWWQTALDAPSLRDGPLFPPLKPHAEVQKTLRTNLSPQLTATLLREAPRAYRMRVDEVLLAALTSAIGTITARDEVLVELEAHGREDVLDSVDMSRTVGWFTTQYPLALPCAAEPAALLQCVHARVASVPQRGFGWGLLEQCADAASRAALAVLPVAEIGFNYLGRFDQTFNNTSRFGFTNESSGAAIALHARMPDRALDINSWIIADSLVITWDYAPQFIPDALAERLASSFERTLQALLDHLRDAEPSVAGSGQADGTVRLAPVPAALEALARDDTVAASWVSRASFEASLPVPSCEALSNWLSRRHSVPADADKSSERYGTPTTHALHNAHSSHDPLTTPSRETLLLPAIPLNALDAPATLFCLHPGYGMVGEYRTLAQALNGRITLIALQAPALRGAPWRGATFEALAAHYAACIAAWQPSQGYALLGWSFGGRLAIAIAELLERRGEHVSFVGMVDTATHRDEGPEPRRSNDEAAALDPALFARAEPSLLGAAFDVDALHVELMVHHALPRIASDLHLWRALRNTADPRRHMTWAPHTAGRLHGYDLDATHTSIVHHPALAAELVKLLAPGHEDPRIA